LKSIADTQDRYPGGKEGWIDAGSAGGVNACWASGQDDGGGFSFENLRWRKRVRNDFAVDVGLSDSASNELRILRPEVHNEYKRRRIGVALAFGAGGSN
jgi:hypothetical protein